MKTSVVIKAAASRDAHLDWQTFGWQGLRLKAPSDWAFVGFGGDEKTGSLRFDAADLSNPSNARGLELRWSFAATQTEDQLRSRIKPLLASVEKDAKKRGVSTETTVKSIAASDRPDRDAQLAFQWRSADAARGRIWHCTTCDRVVVAQIYGDGNGPFVKQANEILAGITCHDDHEGRRRWGLYGLDCQVPTEFKIDGQQLMNVYLQLRFRLGKSEDRIVVEQWNLANVQLKDSYLDEWFDRKSAAMTLGLVSQRLETTVQGHAALEITGRRSGLAYWLFEGMRQVTRLRRPALHYSALLWECPEANSAYLIQAFLRSPRPELVSEIAARTLCHRTIAAPS